MNFIRFDRLRRDEGKALTLPPAVRRILGNIPQLTSRARLALAKFKHMAVPYQDYLGLFLELRLGQKFGG